jgi:hypothetical protein
MIFILEYLTFCILIFEWEFCCALSRHQLHLLEMSYLVPHGPNMSVNATVRNIYIINKHILVWISIFVLTSLWNKENMCQQYQYISLLRSQTLEERLGIFFIGDMFYTAWSFHDFGYTCLWRTIVCNPRLILRSEQSVVAYWQW